jgi:hypothetical protein
LASDIHLQKTQKQKGPNFHSGLLVLCGGERGVRTLDTIAHIHTFQACSFSHSDTSPVVGYTAVLLTGANVGKTAFSVNLLFAGSVLFRQT